MEKRQPDIIKKTSIGGQALIEGIMMRGPETTAMAVRHVSGKIILEEWETAGKNKLWYMRVPFVRGIFNFIDSLRIGYKCLMRSAELSGLEEEEDKKDEKKSVSPKLMSFLMALSAVLGVAVAVVLFVWLPAFLFRSLCKAAPSFNHALLRGVFEGVFRIVLFVGYIALVAQMKDIKRVFMYHGAEHKTIFCYEQGKPLTVENIRPECRFHPRCGTSFMILMLLVGMIVSMLIPDMNSVLRTVVKILTIPVVVGVGYELIKLAGRRDNLFTRIISAPGLWMQRLTTKEPDDSMIECAIAAMERVIPADPEADKW